MKLLLVFFFVGFNICANACIRMHQEVAIISIYKEVGPLFVKDRSIIKRPANYELTKIDNQNYKLVYRGKKPKILYLNENPIYITPGDKVQLNFARISEPGMERDTITASGDNLMNYTYAPVMLLDSKERRSSINTNYPNFTSPKYFKGSISFYDDLNRYDELSWKYVDSVLVARNYNRNIIRQMELDLFTWNMFTKVEYEDRLQAQNKIQANDFARKIEHDFKSRNFLFVDTIYSPNIEGAISMFFVHLEKTKFAGVKDDMQLSKLFFYIKSYPNNFVREYLLCFLMQAYSSRLKEDFLLQIQSEVEKITNPFILDALKNKTNKNDLLLDIKNLMMH
ncbi:hypothetical protein [Pedobacter sp. GR22-6]|uniref:hypothetical protein n=1 Tax=Pedobacter sp. GR22-6 TaxID=3127957 RepID=UPI00307F1CA3